MSSQNSNTSLFYECCRIVLDCFFDTFYGLSMSGSHNIPSSGSLILATNHTSFYDPPIVGISSRRQLHYFARDTLFKGLPGMIIRNLKGIPINRNAADIKSIKATLNALKNNGAIVIFPEGTRSADGKLQEPQAGIGMIACKAKATVIPTRIFGTFEVFGRHQERPASAGAIHVSFGQPMLPGDLDPGPAHPQRYLEVSRRIMKEIARLRSPQQVVV